MNNKKEKKEMGVLGAVFMIILFATIAVGYTISESDYMFSSKPKDIMEALKNGDDVVRGEYAEITIDCENAMILDWYAETKHYVNGFIPVGKERHCILYLNNNTFLSLTVKGKKNISKIDDIIDYLYDTTDSLSKPADITYKGKISTMDSEIRNYFITECNEYTDFLKDYGYTDNFTVYQLTLDASGTKLGAFLLLGFCILMVGVSVWLLSNAIKAKKAEKLAAMSPAAMYNAGQSENGQPNADDPIFGNMYSSMEQVADEQTDDNQTDDSRKE